MKLNIFYIFYVLLQLFTVFNIVNSENTRTHIIQRRAQQIILIECNPGYRQLRGKCVKVINVCIINFNYYTVSLLFKK